MFMTKEHLESLGLNKDSKKIDILCYNLNTDDLRKMGPDYAQIADEQDSYEYGRKSCIECKKSLKKVGCVCEYHYHDYVLFCGYTHCKTCYVHESWARAFTNFEEYKRQNYL